MEMLVDPDLNPYASPLPDPEHPRFATPSHRPWTRSLAWIFVGFSVACAVTFTYVDEIVLKTKYGAWPTVFFSAGLSIIAAVVTRECWIAPLCCFLGTMAADLLAGVLVSWPYAQVYQCIPISLGFSVPALIVAALLRVYWKRAPLSSRS